MHGPGTDCSSILVIFPVYIYVCLYPQALPRRAILIIASFSNTFSNMYRRVVYSIIQRPDVKNDVDMIMWKVVDRNNITKVQKTAIILFNLSERFLDHNASRSARLYSHI